MPDRAEAGPKPRVERRLAAILAADVVGYSRLMGADESGTLERLKCHRRELFEPKLAQHRGRIVKLMGDGALAEFASAVDAVQCAAEIQQAMAERNREVPEVDRIAFRIGINLGDVIVEGDDIYGDGVNVAARLEGLADPGGVWISAKVHDEVSGRLELVFEDRGEQEVKNIARPVRVYKVLLTPADSDMPKALAPPASRPDRPSIVVLAFENMSGDPEQEYFADGIAEDVITDLSKVSGLFIIARNSAFTYKGKAVNLQQVSRELGVRYVLEGSVRKAGNRVRINAQLIDGSSGGHVWAERYDRDLTDIFDVQDEVTREIVAALKVKLTSEEKHRIHGRGTTNVEAYECFLRGREFSQQRTRQDIQRARPYFERAIDFDPAFAAPYAGLAFCHAIEYVNQWSKTVADSLTSAFRLARQAVFLDPAEPQAHYALAMAHLWRQEHDEAIAEGRRTIALAPNFAPGHSLLGLALHYAGRPDEALETLDQAIRLDPFYPDTYLHFVAQCQFALRQYDEVVVTLQRRFVRNPSSDVSRVLLAACYGHLGRAEEARAEWQEALRINPDYSIEHRRQILPYKNPADFECVVEGLRKAGIAV